jgi:hypothetical protein
MYVSAAAHLALAMATMMSADLFVQFEFYGFQWNMIIFILTFHPSITPVFTLPACACGPHSESSAISCK